MRRFSACRRVILWQRTRSRLRPATCIGMHGVIEWLELNGYIRASTVREPGDYAVRGGILDLYPPGMDMPVRLDFFGDALETIRAFDAQTQRSEEQLRGLDLVPVAEFQLITETIRRFRTGYVARIRRGRSRRSALRGRERRPPLSGHGALAAAIPRPARDAFRLPAGHGRWRLSILRKMRRMNASRKLRTTMKRAATR